MKKYPKASGIKHYEAYRDSVAASNEYANAKIEEPEEENEGDEI